MPYKEFMQYGAGLTLNAAPHMIPPQALTSCLNANLDIGGEVKALLGRQKYLDYHAGVDDIFWQNLFTTPSLIARVGRYLYDGSTIVETYLEDEPLKFILYNNWLLFCNGVKNYKYDQAGIELGWLTTYTVAWEKEYLADQPESCLLIFSLTKKLTYSTSQIWEKELLDGELPSNFTEGDYVITSSMEADNYSELDSTYKEHAAVVEIGMAAPTSGPSVAAGAAGIPNGTYRYMVTFANHQTFESLGYASDPITVASKKIELTNIPISHDPQVIARNIYRTEASGATYYLVGSIANSYETTFTDNTADTSLELAYDSLAYKPTAFIAIAEHLGSLYGLTEDMVLYWSNSVINWEYFDVLNNQPMGSSAQTGRDLLVLGKELDAFSDIEIWRRTGTLEDEVEHVRSLSERGTASRKSSIHAGELVLFADYGGLFGFDTIRDIPSSKEIADIFDSKSIRNDKLNEDAVDAITTCYLNNKWYIAYPAGVNTINSDVLLKNTETNVVTKYMLSGVTDLCVDRKKKLIYFAKNSATYLMHTGFVNEDAENEEIYFEIVTKDFAAELGGLGVGKGFGTIKFYTDPKQGVISITPIIDDVEQNTWEISDSGVKDQMMPLNIPGFRLALKIKGTKDAVFYGFGIAYRVGDI